MSAFGPSRPPSDYIGGAWRAIAGDAVQSRDPAAPDRVIWSGTPKVQHVHEAVAAARGAFPAWRALGLEARGALLRRFVAAALTPASMALRVAGWS